MGQVLKKPILLDTDLVIDLLRGLASSKNLFKEIEMCTYDAYLSVVTIAELYAGQSLKSSNERIRIQSIIDLFKLVPVNVQITMSAGTVKRDYSLGLADAIIAASAINYKLNLWTRNIKQFKKVKLLSVHSPY